MPDGADKARPAHYVRDMTQHQTPPLSLRLDYRAPYDWERLLERDDRVDMRTYEVFLDTTLRSKLGQIALGATVVVTALGLLVLWEVERRRRERLVAAAQSALASAS